MKRLILAEAILLFAVLLLVTGCGQKAQSDNESGAPPPAQVEREGGSGTFKVQRPEEFPLATAGKHTSGAGIDRDRRCESRRVALRARRLSRLRPRSRHQGPAGRYRGEGTASPEGAKR